MSVKMKKIIRAFGSGHIGCYRQPGQDPKNYRYRNVILTNALQIKAFEKRNVFLTTAIRGKIVKRRVNITAFLLCLCDAPLSFQGHPKKENINFLAVGSQNFLVNPDVK